MFVTSGGFPWENCVAVAGDVFYSFMRQLWGRHAGSLSSCHSQNHNSEMSFHRARPTNLLAKKAEIKLERKHFCLLRRWNNFTEIRYECDFNFSNSSICFCFLPTLRLALRFRRWEVIFALFHCMCKDAWEQTFGTEAPCPHSPFESRVVLILMLFIRPIHRDLRLLLLHLDGMLCHCL